jgi:hypothetical protein
LHTRKALKKFNQKKIIKLQIQFAEETGFAVPNRKKLPTRMLKLSEEWFSFRPLPMVERPKPCRRIVD